MNQYTSTGFPTNQNQQNNYGYGTNPQNFNSIPQIANQPFTNAITNSIVWVETEEEAKTWMVGPNNRVFVFVNNNDVLYIKEKNSDGRPLKTEIYDLTKRQIIEEGSSIDLKDYVRKEDVSKMISEAVSAALAEKENRRIYRSNPAHRNSYRDEGDE